MILFQRIKKYITDNYWHDPVWSKVIAAGLIFLFGSILTAIGLLIKSIIDSVSLHSAFIQLITFLKNSSNVSNYIIVLGGLIIAISCFLFIRQLIKDIKAKKTVSVEPSEQIKELPDVSMESTVLFSYRFAKAFPGLRGLEWIENPKVAVERLEILLQAPLHFKSNDHPLYDSDPIWWFRNGNGHIESFKKLSKTKVLMNNEELEIKRIAAYQDERYFKCFVYVEVKGEKQTGLYNHTEADIKRHIATFGYSWEEFGLLGKKPIRREQYDDGATVNKGKVIDASDSELRVRYLSDYNFIITGKGAPYNSNKFDLGAKKWFNDILNGNTTAENFFNHLYSYNKFER